MNQSNTRHNLVESVLSQISLPFEINIRTWIESDFAAIQELACREGWLAPLDRPREVLTAWRQSWPTLIATHGETVVGFLRGVTDGVITTYIAELLVEPTWRGKGIAAALIETAHRLFPSARLDLLCTDSTDAFYEAEGFSRFEGYRKTYS